MPSKLRTEIKQARPFSSRAEEALLNIHRTSGQLIHLMHQTLKQYDLTPAQYNVLRILRGAGAPGLRCSEIGERMVSADPDITRLLARLEERRLIQRSRDPKDRRVIHVHITSPAIKILAELDPVVKTSSRRALKHIRADRLKLLIELLEEVRSGQPSA